MYSTSNNNELCVTETLTNIQNATGTTLSTSGIAQLFGQLQSGQLSNIPPSAICTNCTKEAYNIVNGQFPGLATGTVNVMGNVSSVCGADFVSTYPDCRCYDEVESC